MKGYAVLRKDMTYKEGKRPFQIGKEYTIPPGMETMKGFRFIVDLEDIPFQGKLKESRVFEIEAPDEMVAVPYRGCTYRTRQMKFIREVTMEEIKVYLESKMEELVESHYMHRQLLVDFDIGLNYLMYDRLWIIRADIAEKGFGLNILINDEDSDVRRIARDAMRKQNKNIKNAG